ncbi:GAF and ANTAR domain-containing protein [Mycobacterium kubicae]|nr:GAF and ANTAR domain-containing protein [Mycobacterium kubicae]
MSRRRPLIDARGTTTHLHIAEQTRAICERHPDDVSAIVHELAGTAVPSIPGAQYASITVVRRRGQLQTTGDAGAYPTLLHIAQIRHRQGPCVDAARSRSVVHADDLTSDRRWPLYRRDAVEMTPIRSLLAVPLISDQLMLGILNLFADQPGAFSTDAVDIARFYAIQAALAWATARTKEQFRRALGSRDVIGQAKGILMERYDVTADDAFALLKRLSEESKIPVAEVSRRMASKQHGPHTVAPAHTTAGSPRLAHLGRDIAERRQMIRDATRC